MTTDPDVVASRTLVAESLRAIERSQKLIAEIAAIIDKSQALLAANASDSLKH